MGIVFWKKYSVTFTGLEKTLNGLTSATNSFSFAIEGFTSKSDGSNAMIGGTTTTVNTSNALTGTTAEFDATQNNNNATSTLSLSAGTTNDKLTWTYTYVTGSTFSSFDITCSLTEQKFGSYVLQDAQTFHGGLNFAVAGGAFLNHQSIYLVNQLLDLSTTAFEDLYASEPATLLKINNSTTNITSESVWGTPYIFAKKLNKLADLSNANSILQAFDP